MLKKNLAASRTSQPGEVTTSTTRVWVVMAKADAPRVSVTAKEADEEGGSLAFAFAVTAG
jgi:hypothetical protein